MNRKDEQQSSMVRHSRDCRICRHPQREAIEKAFVSWESPSRIAKTFSIHRSTIYLHAAATELTMQRQRNIAGALANFIERCHSVKPTAASFISACIALSKINERGQTIDRVSVSDLNHAFDRFTRGELEKFATEGILPEWYSASLSETQNGAVESLQ